MGMMLRRRNRKAEIEPKQNGKPIPAKPKTKKLNLDPVYPQKVERQVTGINDLVRR